MKLLYIGKTPLNNRYLSLYKSFSIESMHYTNPLKAVDNLNEINPDFIYINKNDFPRLWKIVLTSLREHRDESECLFILEGVMDDEDLKAFNYLKGNNSIDNKEENMELMKKIIIDKTGHSSLVNTYFPSTGELCIGFVNPNDFSFVSGEIVQINDSTLIFTVENSDDLKGLDVDNSISEVSINMGSDVVTVDVKIIDIKSKIICRITDGLEDYSTLTASLFV